MALPDYSHYQYPDFNTGGNFPYQNFLQQLQASFNAAPMNSYGRWNGTGVTTPQGYPAPGTTPNGPPGGYGGGGGLLGAGGAGGAGGGPTVQPQGGPAPSGGAGGGTSPYPQPGPGANDPGFGAAPSSASFANLSDADKAYLYNMANQYRQDLRNQPGAHQLFEDMFPGMGQEQINALKNDIGLNDPLLGQGFNTNAYNGPLKAQYEALVQKMGGTANPYGTWTGGAAAQADALRRFGPNVTDFRTGKKLGLLGG